jgi:hypothetical protein
MNNLRYSSPTVQSINLDLLKYIEWLKDSNIKALHDKKEELISLPLNDICKLITLVDTDKPLWLHKYITDETKKRRDSKKNFFESSAEDYLAYPEDYDNSVEKFLDETEKRFAGNYPPLKDLCLSAVEKYIEWYTSRYYFVVRVFNNSGIWTSRNNKESNKHKLDEIKRKLDHFSNQLRKMACAVKEINEIPKIKSLTPTLSSKIFAIIKIFSSKAENSLPKIIEHK